MIHVQLHTQRNCHLFEDSSSDKTLAIYRQQTREFTVYVLISHDLSTVTLRKKSVQVPEY